MKSKREKELEKEAELKIDQLTEWLVEDLESDGIEVKRRTRELAKKIINLAYMYGVTSFKKSMG